jgi:hypothetical protein
MFITVRQDEVRAVTPEGDVAQKQISFTFNPDEVEMVRAKDGAYIIRQKRPRGEVVPFSKEDIS